MGTLHEDQYTFFIISLSDLLTMRNVSDKRFRETQNTHFVSCKFFPKRDNVENFDTARQTTEDNIARRMRFIRWITKITNTPQNM